MRSLQGTRSAYASTTRAALWLLALGCLLLALVLTPLHWFDVSRPRLVELAAFTPLGTPFAAAAVFLTLVLLAAGGRRSTTVVALLVAAAVLAIHVWWLAPLYVGARVNTRGPALAVLSQNFEYGDADTLARVVRADHVDVLVLTDLQPGRIDAVRATGLVNDLPHTFGISDQANSTAVLSRYPITATRVGPHAAHADIVRLATPQLGEVDLVAAHPYPPYSTRWRIDYHALTEFLRQAIPQPQPVPTIVAGDFNATLDNAPFRDLLSLGYTDVMTQVRGGFCPTWPDSSSRHYLGITVPRLVQIDHVLVSTKLAASDAAVVRVDGADHSGVLARIATRSH